MVRKKDEILAWKSVKFRKFWVQDIVAILLILTKWLMCFSLWLAVYFSTVFYNIYGNKCLPLSLWINRCSNDPTSPCITSVAARKKQGEARTMVKKKRPKRYKPSVNIRGSPCHWWYIRLCTVDYLCRRRPLHLCLVTAE